MMDRTPASVPSRWPRKRAKACSAELHVFTSIANGNGDKTKTSRLHTGLKDAEMMCTACGIACKVQLSEQKQTPAEDIIQYAVENDIEEIIIGLRKRSQLGKLLFGSTSRQVLLEAPCPVLVGQITPCRN